MSTSSRTGITYALGVFTGAVLFFLCFGAVFNGLWPLLLLFVLCFGAAGALGVALGRVLPVQMGIALSIPAMPWVLWLFPATLSEVGFLRAALWPGLVVVVFGLGWLGGKMATLARSRNRRGSRAA